MGPWFCDRFASISKLLRDAAFHYLTADRAVMIVKKVVYFEEFGYLDKYHFNVLKFLRNSRFCSKTR